MTPTPEQERSREAAGYTPGPWIYTRNPENTRWIIDGAPARAIACTAGYEPNNEANALLIAAAPELLEALEQLADVFAYDGEDSMYRFERLAEMFRKDTGYLAPGKDPGMASCQPDGEELRRIYDGWFNAKVQRARTAIRKARGEL
jgi:hypothetical protein